MLAATVLLVLRDSPTAKADLVGRRLGANNRWPFGGSKSVAGTVVFWLSNSVTATGLLVWMERTGCIGIGRMIRCGLDGCRDQSRIGHTGTGAEAGR
jgi:hypothetical protein